MDASSEMKSDTVDNHNWTEPLTTKLIIKYIFEPCSLESAIYFIKLTSSPLVGDS